MPRIEPVPTAPAPAIWNGDFAPARSDARRVSTVRGLRVPARPQNGVGHSASQRSPWAAASAHTSGPELQPCARANQAGSENAKSSPAITGAPAAASSSQSVTCSRVRPGSRRRSVSPRASASQIASSPPALRPDQSTATTRGSEAIRSIAAASSRSSGEIARMLWVESSTSTDA